MVLSVADMVVAHIVCGRDIIMSVTLVYCGQTFGWINMKLGMPVGLGSGHIVLDGDPASLSQKWAERPKYSAHICCGQMAGWIKTQLGTLVGARHQYKRYCVTWGPSPFPHKGGGDPSPIFGPFLLWPNGCMHQDATWCGGRPQPRGLCVRWGPSPP